MINEAKEIVRQDCERVLELGAEKLGKIGDSSILITGGTGFMGSWITEMILRLNETKRASSKIYILGRDRSRFERNLGHLMENPFLEFIRCDIRNVAEIPRDIEYVIHAAGTPDNRTHTTNPIETMVTIAEGTHAILKASDRVANLKMFVNVSSSSIYGTQPLDLLKMPEDYTGHLSNSQVASSYAEAKRYGESLSTAARSEGRMPVVIVRPFSFIGAYQPIDAPWAFNNFIQDAINKRPIRILGDGQTIRSAMYGADMALWMLTIMTNTRSGQTYNLGSDKGISIKLLAEKVANNFQPNCQVTLNASLSGRITNTILVPDTKIAENDFNLQIYTDIDLSLERTIKWYKNQLETGGKS